jgi:hypothetical protein
MTEQTAIVEVKHTGLVKPIVPPQDLIQLHKEVSTLIRDALEENRDFGKIPGTDKPTLLKPGAERLCIAFGGTARYDIVASEIDHDRDVKWVKRQKKWNNAYQGDRSFTWDEVEGKSLGAYRYVVKCSLVRADGRCLGDGLGSCSSYESKYIDRPRDLENTILKMAEKRALVAACLNAFGLSDRFTQDVEDMHDVATKKQAEAVPETPPITTINERQQKLIFARCKDANIDMNLLKKWIQEQFNVASTKDLTKPQMDQVLEFIDKNKL